MYLRKYCPIISLLIFVICGSVCALQYSAGADGSNARAVHEIGITGSGINIGAITISNVLTTHLAFQDSNGVSHAINHDVSGQGFIYTFHDTPFAGIIISRGSLPSHPNDIGVAPDAFVHCVRIINPMSEAEYQNTFNELINEQSCRVIVTGIQLPYGPNYPGYPPPDGNSDNSKIYDYYADTYDVIFANAAGNAVEHYSNITIFGDAHNGITTGGLRETEPNKYFRVGNVTNTGPTLDGRRKPEVTAPSTYQVAPGYSSSSDNYWNGGYGDGATSWAVPHTAGVAALLLQYANQTADANSGHNEVIKAVIVNSTFPNIEAKAGSPTYPADPNNVWHTERGYGKIDALRAYRTLSAGRISRNTTATVSAGWAYENINPYQTHQYKFAGRKNDRFILTVAWNRKINKLGKKYFAALPKFDIDVTVSNPPGNVIFSDIDDANNNLIRAELIMPSDGNYTVLLENPVNTVGDYGLAFEILPPLAGDFNADYIVDELDLRQMALDWLTAEPGTDIIADGRVNWLDFVEFAESWFEIEPRYYNP